LPERKALKFYASEDATKARPPVTASLPPPPCGVPLVQRLRSLTCATALDRLSVQPCVHSSELRLMGWRQLQWMCTGSGTDRVADDTPWGIAKRNELPCFEARTSKVAPSSCARPSTRSVPSPVLRCGRPANPTPSSSTLRCKLSSRASNTTRMRPSRSLGNACLTAFVTSSRSGLAARPGAHTTDNCRRYIRSRSPARALSRLQGHRTNYAGTTDYPGIQYRQPNSADRRPQTRKRRSNTHCPVSLLWTIVVPQALSGRCKLAGCALPPEALEKTRL
jgi:hypothetical protein